MTQFEKAFLGELKAIRTELRKMNEINNDKKVKIPALEELVVEQIKHIMDQRIIDDEIDEKKVTQNTAYDPLSRS